MEKLAWAQLILRLLDVLESILPAVLVARNAKLAEQRNTLTATVETEKALRLAAEREVEIRAKNEGVDRRTILLRQLARSRAKHSAPGDPAN